MTELEFYKFITDGEYETHDNSKDEILIFVYLFLIEDFVKKFEDYFNYSEEGLNCCIRSNYVCLNIVPICEYYDIEPSNIFKP